VRRWIAVALLVAGCKKPPPPPPPPARLVEARLVDRTPDDDRPAPIDAPALEARAARTLAAAAALPLALGQPPIAGIDYRLRVEVKLEGAEVEDRGVLRAFVDGRLERIGAGPDETPIADQALAERVYKRKELGDRAAAFRAHLERAVDDEMKALGGKLKLHAASAGALAAALRGQDVPARDEAIAACAQRKERGCVDALLQLLRGDDAQARDRALGALVEIGDQRAVKPITEQARFRDLAELPKILDALGALGGDEARSFLELVATSHDDEEQRALAKEALERLKRRQAAAPK
jgi:hypothetical protein